MSGLLTASGLSFAYGKNEVLREVGLELFPSEVVALIGPNGSGKSTLIKSLIGFLRARGEINWNAKPLSKWPRRELAKFVAYLAQSPQHEPGQTVLDVLRLGRAPYWQLFGVESLRDAEVVEQVAQRMELTDILHRPIDEISGGQRQLVFVGRALVQEPKAILLDEPNTFLDLRHQVELMTMLKKLSREQHVAVLLASHDLNLAAMHADQLILLDRGQIVAHGTPDEVLMPELLSRVYGVPMERVDRDGRPVVFPKVES
jgi:iron complex transport system ATP-binding protein